MSTWPLSGATRATQPGAETNTAKPAEEPPPGRVKSDNEPNTVVCDTNDQSCSSNSRFNECNGDECNGDAQAVCCKTTPMALASPIPCPISGASFCPSGWSLV